MITTGPVTGAKRACAESDASADMRGGVSKCACSVVALASLLFCASVGDAQTDTLTEPINAIGPLQCLIESVATIDVRTATPHARRRRARSDVVHLEARRIVFEPITTSLAHVRTLDGEPTIQGDARQPWTIYLAIPFERSGVQVSPGAEIQRFAVRDDALVADLDLGNGLVMLRARIPCASLTLGTTEPTAVSTPDTRQAHRHARALTLSVRARPEQGIEAVRLRVPRTLVWQELGRREPFVHVRATLPYGSVDAWAYDTDFVE